MLKLRRTRLIDTPRDITLPRLEVLLDLISLPTQSHNRPSQMLRQRIRARSVLLVNCFLQIQMIRDAHDGREVVREGCAVLVDRVDADGDAEQGDDVADRISYDQGFGLVDVVGTEEEGSRIEVGYGGVIAVAVIC